MNLPDTAATERLGAALADRLPDDVSGWTLLLAGDLGAGKSTLARAMLRELGQTGPIPSPTYTLVEPYALGQRVIYHIDLYRIADVEELHFLGVDELADGLQLIEWPERVPMLADTADVRVELRVAGDGRHAQLHGLSERGRALIAAIGQP